MNLTAAQSRTLEMLAVHHEAHMMATPWNIYRWIIAGQSRTQTLDALRKFGLIESDSRTARLSAKGRRVALERGLMSRRAEDGFQSHKPDAGANDDQHHNGPERPIPVSHR